MRFLTFNLWHGLSPTSVLAFEALEPAARRHLREDLQLDILARIQADVCFFQEVNPWVARVARFKTRLGAEAAVQPDLVGLKLFGLGLPYNLNSALVTLASRRLGLRKVDGVSLSRPDRPNLSRSWGSWQLSEERHALFAETILPKFGRALLVNTHLHHGLESTTEMLQALDKLASELELGSGLMSELKSRLFSGNQRREQELKVLLARLKAHESRYEMIVVAGDFNASPESALAQAMRDAGFRDAWVEARATMSDENAGYTFDGERNRANHILQSRFPLTLVLEDLSFSSRVKEALLALAHAQERRRRRIDYIWFRAGSAAVQVKRAELVGLPDRDGLAPSDHFGVCADLEVVN